MQIETEQVVLTLTSDKNILSALRTNKAFRTDKVGKERLVRQFNSQDFEFQAGSRITVGKTVAAALKRDSSFVMGDGLTGPLVCPLVEVGSFEAGKGVGNLSCPHCTKQFKNTPSLGHHLIRARSECPEYKGKESEENPGGGEPVESEPLAVNEVLEKEARGEKTDWKVKGSTPEPVDEPVEAEELSEPTAESEPSAVAAPPYRAPAKTQPRPAAIQSPARPRPVVKTGGVTGR